MARKKINTVDDIKNNHRIYSILLFLLAAYLLISLIGLDSGAIGRGVTKILRTLFGYGAFLFPLLVGGGALFTLWSQRPFWKEYRFYTLCGVFLFGLVLFHQAWVPINEEIMPEQLPKSGGLLAGFVVFICRKYIGTSGTWIVALGGFGSFFAFSFGEVIWKGYQAWKRNRTIRAEEKATHKEEERSKGIKGKFSKSEAFDYQNARYPFEEEDFSVNEAKTFGLNEEDFTNHVPLFQGLRQRKSEGPVPWEEGYQEYWMQEQRNWEKNVGELEVEPENNGEWEFEHDAGKLPSVRKKGIRENLYTETPIEKTEIAEKKNETFAVQVQSEAEKTTAQVKVKVTKPYRLPPLTLLSGGGKKANSSKNEIREKASLLEKTLEEFGVRAQVINYSQGPAVTRYELELAPGVKVNRILNLTDDLALKLASSGIRIEAPIPGKAAVGIEVPNKTVSSVSLKDVLDTADFKGHQSKLSVGLGKDIAGTPVIANLAEMPHLLVAGATGSGKSVCINTIITSILFKALPTEVKFILVDPKKVELSHYNNIPHLLTPVVNDPKQAAAALRWAVREMERRYALLAAASVRDLGRYNELAEEHQQEKLPQIVVIIDELADLMMVSPVEVQDAIARLAQMARAAGIHLILATQRPSVDVITGLIKANIPSRISFAVSSQIDSRTILDMGGAEKLLGKGDMLFSPAGMSKPLRVQGAFISDQEVERLLDFVKNQSDEEPEYVEGVTTDTDLLNDPKVKEHEEKDELWEDALRIIMDTGQASTSMLQRRFRIGFSRAGRLIDQMEQLGIVGPPQGSKPRDLLMSPDQIYQNFFEKTE